LFRYRCYLLIGQSSIASGVDEAFMGTNLGKK